jgi:cyclophilin family peptidyl-prolyl cis-trans isomerase
MLSAQTQPTESGLYALFTIKQGETALGGFTCQLEFEKVPDTVANFAKLANGTRNWMDLNTLDIISGVPFYDGLIFHRIFSGFILQSGSRNGTGTDSPGFNFPDQFHPDLSHNQAGILSMANAGENTNSSQFFITLAATSWLDRKHAVFGRVLTEDLGLIHTMGAVSVDNNNKPLTPLTIEHVEIRAIGSAAQAFLEATDTLPALSALKPTLSLNSGVANATFTREPYNDYYLYQSNDLHTWTDAFYEYGMDPVQQQNVSIGAITKTTCFKLSTIDYGYLPENLVGKTIHLIMTSSDPDQTLDFTLTSEESATNTGTPLGTFNLDGTTSGNVLAYIWETNKQFGILYILPDTVPQLDVFMKFTGQNEGNFTAKLATTAATSAYNFFGTFTIEDAAPQ